MANGLQKKSEQNMDELESGNSLLLSIQPKCVIIVLIYWNA